MSGGERATIDHDPRPFPAAVAVVSSVPGSFAWSVLTRRHPDLIAAVRRLVTYPPAHDLIAS